MQGIILPSYMGIVISHCKDPGSLLSNQDSMVSRSFFFFFRGSIVPSILSISSLNTGTGGAKEDSGRPDVTRRAEQISFKNRLN